MTRHSAQRLQRPASLAISLLLALGLLALPTFLTMPATATTSVTPNAVNNLDCNGYSQTYQSIRPAMKELCTDPFEYRNGWAYHAVDNGRYVGHDEPSVKFISNSPGTADQMTYVMQLAADPHGQPSISASGPITSNYAELSPAPWFGLPICDPQSYPQNPCTPDSDTNIGSISASNAAGSAFMELQFYPPGYPPFYDAPSCDATRYCAALNIDSYEATFNFAYTNPNCAEPVNFAYIQTNGVPAGPPSPQLTNISTFTPNAQTLMMNQGDWVRTTISDTVAGLSITIQDLTTGQSGSMVASAANGFMNTNINTCAGTPFNFHAEYSSAAQQNQVPWAALEGGVLMEDEIGHFEPCASVTNPLPISAPGFSDPSVAQTCVGGFDSAGGEGPCSPSTFMCLHATTEGGLTCPTHNATAGALCEFSDAMCMPQGPRAVQDNGVTDVIRWPISGCEANYFQNGDLDYDGSPYVADWPDGFPAHPTTFRYSGPFGPGGQTYPNIQFETDAAGSEGSCNVTTGVGCTVPPVGAAFYPFWTLGRATQAPSGVATTACQWNFGNTIPGTTMRTFGGTRQYGTPDVARYGGTLTSPVLPNPQVSGC